jgi:hypothetical protein
VTEEVLLKPILTRSSSISACPANNNAKTV